MLEREGASVLIDVVEHVEHRDVSRGAKDQDSVLLPTPDLYELFVKDDN